LSAANTPTFTVDELLAHPFYREPLRPWGGKPWRSRIQVSATGCFEWQGAFNSKGYPSMGPRGLAHRLAWMAIMGPIPTGHELHHACGVKSCINVTHLQCLTSAQHAAIEGRPRKLDEEKAVTILRLLDAGATRSAIARLFGVSPSHISGIKAARSWRTVVLAYYQCRQIDGMVSEPICARAA
jgi:hypothetical protein